MMRRYAQQGYLMIIAVALILIIGFIGVSVAYLFNASSRAGIDHLLSDQAFYIAESGLEATTYKLLTTTLSNRTGCASAGATNVAVGQGVYTVTTVGPTYATAANISNGGSPLSATATTIPVDSTTGYASSGRILIDRESIDYTGTTATSFTGVSRGRDDTTAATHADGASIGQYQCDSTSQGGVPNLNTPANPGNPIGKRILTRATQLQDGWIVGGSANATTRVFPRWNKPTEVSWNNNLVAGTSVQAINNVTILSYADAWAVGNGESSNLNILHWDGTSWTKVLPAVALNVNLNGVNCVASNDCWVVGAANSNTPAIEHWNGTTWTRILPTANVNAALNSIDCNNTSDCWAVGVNNSNTPLIEHWNGTNWSRVVPTANANVAANGVSCNSTTNCWAVGNAVGGNPLIEHWNGTNWSLVTPVVAVNAPLNSVYCNSTIDCWAVGNVNSSNLFIEHWNGTNWSRVLPASAVNASLNGVSCINSNDCWAVGASNAGQDLIMHWDGTSWSRYNATGLTVVTLNGLALIGAHSKPNAAWQETFP